MSLLVIFFCKKKTAERGDHRMNNTKEVILQNVSYNDYSSARYLVVVHTPYTDYLRLQRHKKIIMPKKIL